jgi:hypothetical protein
MTDPKDLSVVETDSPMVGSVDALLSQAVKAGATIDTLERLMALRKDMLAEKAKEAFNTAMASFQAECPVIRKTKAVKTNDGKVAYRYAPIEMIVSQVKDLIEKHGFRYTTSVEFSGDIVKAICRVVHTLGHEEVSVMPVPLGTKTQIMSQTQVVAAASTFAKRYAFLNAFGIMTGDEDTDAAPMPPTRADPRPEPSAPVQQQRNVWVKKVVPTLPTKLPEDAIPPASIRYDQTKKLFAVWADYMKAAGKDPKKEGKTLRTALMQDMFGVDSSTKLNEREAEELISRIENDTIALY